LQELMRDDRRNIEFLRSESNDSFEKEAQETVRKLLEEANAERFRPVDQDVVEIEIALLVRIVLQWRSYQVSKLDLFPYNVFETEFEVESTIAGLPVRGIIDRLDRIGNSYIVIDYKSSIHSVSAFTDARIKDAQLPVYAYALRQMGWQVFMLGYETVNSNHAKLRFYPEKTAHVETFPSFLRRCDEKLELLSQQFQSGDAQLNPMGGACDYCSIAPVCRIREFADMVKR